MKGLQCNNGKATVGLVYLVFDYEPLLLVYFGPVLDHFYLS